MTPRPHEFPAVHLLPALAAAIPVLRSGRLVLRAPRLDDFDALADLCASPRAAGMGGPLSRADAWGEFMQMCATWVLRGHGWWTVTEAEAVAGFVGIGFEPGDREPELGWMLVDGAEGRGLATEAALLARDWARAAGLPALVSYIDTGNPRSAAVAARLGASRDAAAEAALADEAPGTQVWRHPMGALQ